jgi:uncharacterized membrane protein
VFSDGAFAVLITVLVLELCPPKLPTFEARLLLWPTWLSYAVSYLFIAVWTNHHPPDVVSPRARKIMRFRSSATLCLFGLAAVIALKFPLV